MVSDGAPVDDSTLTENAADNLENHLRGVISAIGQGGDVQLSAIGINYAVDRYYQRSIVIDTPEDLGGAVLLLIEQILSVKTTKTGISSK